MAGPWMEGASYSPTGGWNAYTTYYGGGSYEQPYSGGFVGNNASPKSGETADAPVGGWEAAGRGAGTGWSSGQASGSATGGAISGAANGYAQGGWTGAVVGGISGYFSGKEAQKGKQKPLTFEQQMELATANDKYREEVRLKQQQEMKDAMGKYTDGITPNRQPMTNGLFSNGGSPMFGVQQPTQPVVNPEQNSYGLLRGQYGG